MAVVGTQTVNNEQPTQHNAANLPIPPTPPTPPPTPPAGGYVYVG